MVVGATEKGERGNRDWFGAIYFGFFALFCLYLSISGGSQVPSFVAYPLIFTVTITFVLSAFLYISLLLSDLRQSFSSSYDIQLRDRRIGEGALLFLTACVVYALFSHVIESEKQELLSPLSIFILSISILQVFLQTFPKRKAPGLRQFLSSWLDSAASYGKGPGLFAIAVIMSSLFLIGILSSNEPDGITIRFVFFFALLSVPFILKQNGDDKKRGWPLVAGILLLSGFLTLASPYALGLLRIGYPPLLFSIGYAALAWLGYSGYRPD